MAVGQVVETHPSTPPCDRKTNTLLQPFANVTSDDFFFSPSFFLFAGPLARGEEERPSGPGTRHRCCFLPCRLLEEGRNPGPNTCSAFSLISCSIFGSLSVFNNDSLFQSLVFVFCVCVCLRVQTRLLDSPVAHGNKASKKKGFK